MILQCLTPATVSICVPSHTIVLPLRSMRMRVKVGVRGKAAQWLGAVRRDRRMRYCCQFLYLHAQTKCVCMWWVVCVCVRV